MHSVSRKVIPCDVSRYVMALHEEIPRVVITLANPVAAAATISNETVLESMSCRAFSVAQHLFCVHIDVHFDTFYELN